ncbi:hypothetical protein DHEL01_v204338 [Diaporthe helianthi]|uniref:Uncharacterized protein n=1 Tax=Diaporthe helianthi TaxID=158607 RepID=A0A2P5I430_DIAHE|nr:hypothetical protein DHEL01_v204338 [Diaporthe helianthi]
MPITAGLPQFASQIGDPSFRAVVCRNGNDLNLPLPASGSDVKRKFSSQDRSSVARAQRSEPDREPMGSRVTLRYSHTSVPLAGDFRTTVIPFLDAGSPSLPVCDPLNQVRPSPSELSIPIPSMLQPAAHKERRSSPPPPSATPYHASGAQGPGLEPEHSTAQHGNKRSST